MKAASFVGKTVGRLRIVEEIEPVKYLIKNGPRAGGYSTVRRYLCECQCGRKTHSRHNDIAAGIAKSCGCLRRQQMSEHPIGRKEKGSSYLRYMYGYYTRNAAKKGVSFVLSAEEFKTVVTGACYYCGNPPVQGTNQSRPRLKNVFYGTIAHNGIDRLIPSKGYAHGNVVSCCLSCNIAKHTMTEKEFYSWVRRVSSFTAGR